MMLIVVMEENIPLLIILFDYNINYKRKTEDNVKNICNN
jgi:hypothetical protein